MRDSLRYKVVQNVFNYKNCYLQNLREFNEKTAIISSSSSYRASRTDIPDPLSLLLPIVHRPR